MRWIGRGDIAEEMAFWLVLRQTTDKEMRWLCGPDMLFR